jgi:hypothetical protein
VIALGDPTQESTFTVWGTNHNFYNTEWQTNEAMTDCVGSGNLRLFPNKIGSPAQRQTALASVMAFFRGNVGNANPDFNQIFNPEFALPPFVTAVTRVDRGYTDGPVLEFEDFRNTAGTNTYGIPNEVVGISMIHAINAIPNHNARSDDRSQTDRPAGRIFWAAPGGYFQTNWTAPGQGANISQLQTLEFRVSRQCVQRNPANRALDANGTVCAERSLNPDDPSSDPQHFRLGVDGSEPNRANQLFNKTCDGRRYNVGTRAIGRLFGSCGPCRKSPPKKSRQSAPHFANGANPADRFQVARSGACCAHLDKRSALYVR